MEEAVAEARLRSLQERVEELCHLLDCVISHV